MSSKSVAFVAVLGLSLVCLAREVSTPVHGKMWQAAEWTFVSASDYSAGGGDAVRMDMTFEHAASGQRLVRPGFWDGERIFKVRFAPTVTGKWTWKVSCPGDAAMDGMAGEFEAEPYAGDLAIYRHGFVRAEPGKKYLVHADGTPFFYLGDTHWGMYREEIDEPGPHAGETGATSHFKYIVNRRAEQGFTVYQSEPIDAKFNVRDGRVDASDIAGFQLADRYYQAIAEAGLVHANGEFFFASELTPQLAQDEAAIERLCRYWNARFGAYPVMWTLAQEIDNDFYSDRKQKHNFYSATNNPWVKIAECLHKHDAYAHPLSGHQENTTCTTVTNSIFADPAVASRAGHDWWAAQWSPALVTRINYAIPAEYWKSERPAINYEGRYCYLWTKDFGSRAQGWISFLNGFCGYGYGTIDQWLYRSTYDINRNSSDGVETITVADKAEPWCRSLEFPSAAQVGYMRKFFERLPWWELEPNLGSGKFYAPASKAAVASVAAKGGELYVLYFNGTNVFTGKLKGCRLNKVYSGSWFNPRTGETVASSDMLSSWGGEVALPEKPDAQDWVFTARLTDKTSLNILGREVAIRAPNYDRKQIAPYKLEDPLTFLDGRRVQDARDWAARREEILGVFAREMYGQPPPAPETVVTELVDEKATLAGFALRRQYRMWFKADKTGPCINWIVWLPRHAKRPVPVISFLNYRGNHELVYDEDIPVTKAWLMNWSSGIVSNHRANPRNRGIQQRTDQNTVFPLGTILARGYAVMSACYGEVSPDVDETPSTFAYTGVFDLWGKRDESRDDNITSIGAWGWALSRGLDLAERIPEIDAKRSVVTGCSRLGKAALIAAARDERFAVCVPNQTGGGGVPLAKRDFGENVSTENRMFSHWYCKAYAKYAADPAKLLTFDQHLLLACIAPRALLVEGFNEDWFDTEGEYLAVKAASPVWTLFHGEGLPDVGWPACYDTSAIGGRLGYVRRSERHGISAQDWAWTLDFADGVFKRPLWSERAVVPRERIEWQDTWIESAEAQDAALPRVLMLGDSISRQYRNRVGALLAGKARIANSAGSHCVGDPMLAEANGVLLDAYKFDVIVVNNGLHGWNCPDADYARYLAQYIDFLRAKAPKAKFLWARTTPLSVKGDLATISPENARVETRNVAADGIMAERGITCIDLYTAMMENPADYHNADGTHFNDKGVEVLAAAVAEAVLDALAK